MTGLPRGIGVVRIESPFGVLTVVSDQLSRREEEAGRIAATALAFTGRPIVILSIAEIARLIARAA